jgi:hypothetical protein
MAKVKTSAVKKKSDKESRRLARNKLRQRARIAALQQGYTSLDNYLFEKMREIAFPNAIRRVRSSHDKP